MIAKFRKRDQKFLKRVVKERDVPNWYRGLSTFQRKAADALLNCIRDDIEQATTHRVRDVLRVIGIEPLVRPSRLKFVMQLSRGNDIAFLWFLMELYYRNSPGYILGRKEYTITEQIFLSTIAYLDLLPTLRELNKLLPKQIEVEDIEKPLLSKKVKKSIPVSPYFAKQPRPELYGKELSIKELTYKADFIMEYGNYLNPNYVASNETNRWFANIIVNRKKRVAQKFMSDEINAILNEEVPKNLTLCVHHQNLKAMKEKLANELMVAKRKACEEYFDVEKLLKNSSFKRVMKQLKSDINRIEKDLKTFKSLPFGNKAVAQPKTQALNHDAGSNENSDCIIEPKNRYFKAPTKNTPFKFNYEKIFEIGVCKDVVKDAVVPALGLSGSSGNLSLERNRAIQKYCKRAWKKKVEQHKRSVDRRVFSNVGSVGKPKSKLIKDNKSEASKLTLISQSHYKQIMESNSTLFSQKSKYNLTLQNNEPNQLEFMLKLNLRNEKDRIPYDPRNFQLMDMILDSGLKELRKNKKLVLATFPEAYKYPILREWTKHRYGMHYTKQEKMKAFLRAKKVFQVVRKQRNNVRIPQLDELAEERLVSYGCRDYLLKKSNYLRAQYEDKVKKNMMNNAGICWGAIGMYHCAKIPPRAEFFSYMPPRLKDCHVFRPWRASEFIRAKEEWDKRQRKLKSEF